MNEILFFLQIAFILTFAFLTLKIGKEALICWVTLQALIANLFVLKQIHLFGLDVTASDSFAIGSLLGLNFIQEYYHRQEAIKATWICFFFLFFFAVISQLHLCYHPNIYDHTQSAYATILSVSPRLLFASMSVFFLVQQFDIRFFTWLKKRCPTASFPLRVAISLILSQMLDTVLFSFAGLYGIVFSIMNIIFMSFLIKLIAIFLFTFCMKWINKSSQAIPSLEKHS